MDDIPTIDMKDDGWEDELQFCLSTTDSSSDYKNTRDRPYNGQVHTDDGERGKQLISGLTMRDVRDCFVKGFLQCSGARQPELSESVEKGTWRTMDIFKIDLSEIDPLAVAQCMGCEIEKMMGIFPNCELLSEEAMDKFLGKGAQTNEQDR